MIAAKFRSGSEKAEQLVSDFRTVIVVVVGGFLVVVVVTCTLFVGVAISSRAASELLRSAHFHIPCNCWCSGLEVFFEASHVVCRETERQREPAACHIISSGSLELLCWLLAHKNCKRLQELTILCCKNSSGHQRRSILCCMFLALPQIYKFSARGSSCSLPAAVLHQFEEKLCSFHNCIVLTDHSLNSS